MNLADLTIQDQIAILAHQLDRLKADVAKLEAEATAIKSEPRELWGDAALVF